MSVLFSDWVKCITYLCQCFVHLSSKPQRLYQGDVIDADISSITSAVNKVKVLATV